MRWPIVISVLLLLFVRAGMPDPERTDNYYRHFENDIPDGFCRYEIPVSIISEEQKKGKNGVGEFPKWFYRSSDWNVGSFVIYPVRDGWLSIPVPFDEENTLQTAHFEDCENLILAIYGENHEAHRWYESSEGGIVVLEVDKENKKAHVLLKARSYFSESYPDPDDVIGNKPFVTESYRRPYLIENGELTILPVDSSHLENFTGAVLSNFTPLQAGTYVYRDSLKGFYKKNGMSIDK